MRELSAAVKPKPRQMLFSSTASFNSLPMIGHARAIRPPTMTASGLRPFMRFDIPTPRYLAVSFNAFVAHDSPAIARSISASTAAALFPFIDSAEPFHLASAARSDANASQHSRLPDAQATGALLPIVMCPNSPAIPALPW